MANPTAPRQPAAEPCFVGDLSSRLDAACIHSCLGAALARLEGRIALDAMLDFMPEYEVDRAGLRKATQTSVAGWTNVPVRVRN
ncbi:hypothetical protein NG2371_04118 [Nocardia gamkensis]|nr:hypothetical protein [Nocardia gamkensis]